VKETLFNKLMGLTGGARVLDLFAGTGISALRHCHVKLPRGFRRRKPKEFVDLRENLKKLRVEDGFSVTPIDVFKYLKRYEGEPYQIILADPPLRRSGRMT